MFRLSAHHVAVIALLSIMLPIDPWHWFSPRPTPDFAWPWQGPFGRYDEAAVRRGFNVYAHECAACHTIEQVRFSDLTGLDLSRYQVRQLVGQWTFRAFDPVTGRETERPAEFHETLDARMSGPIGADIRAVLAVADLSTIAKARAYAPDTIFLFLAGAHIDLWRASLSLPEGALSTGPVRNARQGHMAESRHFLAATGVDTETDAAQAAYDEVSFLAWAAEPHLDERKSMGLFVIGFLVVFAALLFLIRRRVWSEARLRDNPWG